MLVVIGGLPGVGKTTIGRALSARIRATYLRIDVIEQTLRAVGPVGAMGYVVAMALAEREEPRLVIDTAVYGVDAAIESILAGMRLSGYGA